MKRIRSIIISVIVFTFVFGCINFVKADEKIVNVVNKEETDNFKRTGAPYGEDDDVLCDGILRKSARISLPSIFWFDDTDSNEITVKNESNIPGYKLFYQIVVNRDKSKFDAINEYDKTEISAKYKADLEELEPTVDKLQVEDNALHAELLELEFQYDDIEDKTSDEAVALKEQVEAKQAEYDAKEAEYLAVNEQYNNLWDDYQEYLNDTKTNNTPLYDDTKWQTVNSGDKLYLAEPEGEFYGFVVWAKIEYTGENNQKVTEYRSAFYSSQWSGDDEDETDEKELNVIVVNDINGDFTTADKPIPQTGDISKVVIGSIVVLIGAGYVLFRKYKNTQIK